MITSLWHRPATIQLNNFIYKSLSNWSCNIAIGCEHACRFCYVPDVSTNRMAKKLKTHGVNDPDAEWGDYVFLRPWDEKAFTASLRKAETTDLALLNKDGNRAVMFCTTTDPYQVLRSQKSASSSASASASVPVPVPVQSSGFEVQSSKLEVESSNGQSGSDFNPNAHLTQLVRRALTLIRDRSTLNVRILTRSPLAKRDFDLMRTLGPRCLFGMSIPTLNNQLAKIYEPRAPAPTQRLACLRAAKAAGLHVYAAVAPTYPECEEEDLRATLTEIQKLDPVTIFMEPINIRAENVARIEAHAATLGIPTSSPAAPKADAGGSSSSSSSIRLHTEVFSTPETWSVYALKQLLLFESVAGALGIPASVLHLWPDKALMRFFSNAKAPWLTHHWKKISAWPK